jgi:hypothetical protein
MALWLKVGALVGWRHASTSASGWGELGASLAVGVVIGVLALGLWGLVGPLCVRALGGDVPRRRLRVAAAAGAFPQIFCIAVLLPLDLLIVGPASFTADKLSDPLATAWAAISVALALSCLAWSVYLFVKGLALASGLSTGRALLASCEALVTLLIGGGALIGLMAVIAGATT